ncbi:MAG: Rne/Rng family ribonuclease [Proteobacteria bacterium]|nr:Rne/Rng family ribonuclease [Pseudomonadota bacterium]NOG61352.1 Rne/Rng family ribonuclease [Pseudomonadota bacterium]
MSEEILINVTPQETRVSVVENGILQEVHIERTQKRGLVGNIFKGRVSRVLPGMQAAFIDIGLERTGFLHSSDIVANNIDSESELNDSIQTQPIEMIISEGDEILVQVVKDPIGSKGARLTTRLSIPSRYVVFVPEYPSIGISQRIEDEAERERLRNTILSHVSGLEKQAMTSGSNVILHETVSESELLKNGGFIVRTAAENIPDDDIIKDIEFLKKIWDSIMVRANNTFPPGNVYEDLPLVMRTMRDLVHSEIGKVRIDSKETYQRVTEFSKHFIPELLSRIEYYTGSHPIMDMYSVEDEIQRSLNRKVSLKSGGYLIIDQTEAMTTIDVNTGAFVGHRNQEETIYKTNLEAAHTIARQLRLRNLGGIIIIDFIDMKDAEHGRQVLRSLEKNVEKDHSKTIISELTSLGLVQLTRKRTRESLEHILCETCPTCNGRASIKTAETVCYEIFREILREVRQFDANKLLVVASQRVVDMLLDDESTSVAELETFIDRPITFQVETLYTQEQYDIVLL